MVDTLTGRRGIEVVTSLDGVDDVDYEYEVQLSGGVDTQIVTYILRESITHGKYDATTPWAPLRQVGRA